MEISIFILADGSLQCVFIYGVQSENAWESLQLLLQVITDHFFVSRNFTQMSARWHWSKITILALRWFPQTPIRDPRNNLCLCPFSNSGEWTLFVLTILMTLFFWQVFKFWEKIAAEPVLLEKVILGCVECTLSEEWWLKARQWKS